MRKTFRIDDDLHRELKELAKAEKVSLTMMFNKIIRRGLEADVAETTEERHFDEETRGMTEPSSIAPSR